MGDKRRGGYENVTGDELSPHFYKTLTYSMGFRDFALRSETFQFIDRNIYLTSRFRS